MAPRIKNDYVRALFLRRVLTDEEREQEQAARKNMFASTVAAAKGLT
jgi:hypothetical protein